MATRPRMRLRLASTVSTPAWPAYAKANPGKLTYASSGTGNSLHLTAELFKSMAGVDIVQVPYRGSAPALIDLIGGPVQLMFDGVASSLELCVPKIRFCNSGDEGHPGQGVR